MNFEHYFTRNPTSRLKYYEFETIIKGYRFSFKTSTGVFSPKRVDRATRLLCENMLVEKGDDFLDLGCGYGVVGVVAGKLGAKVVLSDVNNRALKLARENLQRNNVEGVVIASDGFNKISESFDNIVLNPPIATGMKNCKELIKDSYEHLNNKGVFQLVARHNKGGSRLEAYMNKLFNNVKTLVKQGGFRVYVSEKV